MNEAALCFGNGRNQLMRMLTDSHSMSTRLAIEVSVRIDESALGVLNEIGRDKFKILVTMGSTYYESCCGVYCERNLSIQMVEKIDDSSELIRLKEDPPLYINKEALELVKSRRNYFTIYADSKGELYSDQ